MKNGRFGLRLALAAMGLIITIIPGRAHDTSFVGNHTGQSPPTYDWFDPEIMSVTWAPNSNKLIFVQTSRIGIVDVTRKNPHDSMILDRKDRMSQVEWSSDGKLLAACDGTRVVIWSVKSRRITASIPISDVGMQIQWRRNNEALIVGDFTGVSVVDVKHRRESSYLELGRRIDVANAVGPLSFVSTPDGRTIIVCDEDGVLSNWRPGKYKHGFLQKIQQTSSPHLSPNGRTLATLDSNSSLRIWRFDLSHRLVPTESPMLQSVRDLEWRADSRVFVASAQHGNSNNCDIIVCNRNGKHILTFPVGKCNFLRLCPNGTRIVTADDQRINIWNLAKGKLVSSINFPEPAGGISPRSVAWNRDGDLFSVGTQQGRLYVYSAQGKLVLKSIARDNRKAVISGTTVSFPDTLRWTGRTMARQQKPWTTGNHS